jgi:hypothetical protein
MIPTPTLLCPFDSASHSLLFGTATCSKGHCRPYGLSNFAPASPVVIPGEAKNLLCPLRSPLSRILIPNEARLLQLLVNCAGKEKARLPAA